MQLFLIGDAYLAAVAFLGLYGLHRLSLLWRFRWPSAGGDGAAETRELEPPELALERPLPPAFALESGAYGTLESEGLESLGSREQEGLGSGRDGTLERERQEALGSRGHGALESEVGTLESEEGGTPACGSFSTPPWKPGGLPDGPGRDPTREEGVVVGGGVPTVTVQLPLFNERTVAARLIRAVGAMRWPDEALEIQVLDDSTDETREIVEREVAVLREQGRDAVVMRRADRSGYKAGALEHGLGRARGELIAIFDADFLPPADFLQRAVPAFGDPGVGMVQARWEHVNREESWLTRAQSTLLDGHFVIEHKVRADSGLYFNFNGTAGIWRRRAIEEAGGWQHDTLTEDLDLSYRAQLAGWRFVYLPLLAAPAEVPPTISSFKSQQHRWAKGSVQVTRKLATRILGAEVPWRIKLEAAAHLTGNVGYPVVLALAVFLPLAAPRSSRVGSLGHLAIFCVCTLSVFVFYDRSQRALGRNARSRLRDVSAAVALGIGMCVSQSRAVLEGLLQRTGEFVRTPKRGDAGGDGGGGAIGYRVLLRGLPGLELFVSAWLVYGVVHAIQEETWTLLPFLLLFLWGFTWVGALSVLDWARGHRL